MIEILEKYGFPLFLVFCGILGWIEGKREMENDIHQKKIDDKWKKEVQKYRDVLDRYERNEDNRNR